MEPDDARQFFFDLVQAMHNRMNELSDDKFNKPYGYKNIPPMEKAKQHYGTDKVQFFVGLEAALRQWDESGEKTKELKDKYQGAFVEGVKIGERLAVYQGTEFTFSSQKEEEQSDESGGKFTFSQ